MPTSAVCMAPVIATSQPASGTRSRATLTRTYTRGLYQCILSTPTHTVRNDAITTSAQAYLQYKPHMVHTRDWGVKHRQKSELHMLIAELLTKAHLKHVRASLKPQLPGS